MASSPPSASPRALSSRSRRASRIVSVRLRIRRYVRNSLGVPRAVRHSLKWDLLAGACAGAFMGSTFPFFTKIARDILHAPYLAIALMTAAPFIGNLLAPIWARQMEGRAKMPFVIGSWVSGRSLLFLMPFAVVPWAFIGIVSALQFIGTISTPAYTSLMKDIYPDRARGRLMGYVRVGAQSCMFLATLTAGRLLDHHVSYRWLFPVGGLLGIGAAYCFSHVRPWKREKPGNQEPLRVLSTRAFALDTVSILRENEPYRWFALSVFTYGFGNLMVQPLYALFQVDVLNISNTQIANLVNFASILSIFGAFFWGRFIDRHGAPRTVLLGIILITAIPIVYLTANSVSWLFFAAALSGFGFAGIELSYMASILTYAEPGRAAQYQALHSLLLGIRGVIAPIVGIPLMKAIGYEKVFVIALIIMAIGSGMQWLATKRGQRQEMAA